jgi:peptidoglycan hydrolase-like protein with peptidoglycan-binding domain
MYYSGPDRKELVILLQRMLKELGHDIGSSGPEGDGVDGIFGDDTEAAVNLFQENGLDWEGEPLKADGLVGHRTSDALNRKLVGRWYEHYRMPEELSPDMPCHTVTPDFLSQGLSIEAAGVKKARVFLVGSGGRETTLIICLIDIFGKPLGDANYALEIDDPSFERIADVTDANGLISQKIPASAKTGRLILDTHVFDLLIRDLDPASTIKGAVVRLSNLGYLADENILSGDGQGSGQADDLLTSALMQFQDANGLEASGELDEPTASKLEEKYGG